MTVAFKRGKALSGLSLTPLIDVVFLLLIFFLVATKFEEQERELSIVLPQASEARPLVSRPNELFVNVDQRGRYFVRGQQLSPSELSATLEQASANNPAHQTVIIRADKRCLWEPIVSAMNLCNRANIRDYFVTTAEVEP